MIGGPNLGETTFELDLDLLPGPTYLFWVVVFAVDTCISISYIRVLFAEVSLILPRVWMLDISASLYYGGYDRPRLDLALSMEDFVGRRWLLLLRCLLTVSVLKFAAAFEPSCGVADVSSVLAPLAVVTVSSLIEVNVS